MRRFSVIVGLEIYAVLLALLQMGGGVRTDEAKYLLNIPYPHPPAVRWILSQFDAWSHQELFFRVLFATLMVQAVWLVWDMARKLSQPHRWTVSLLWLLSGGVVLQAGTVMMAPLTALQALVFLWTGQRKVSAPLIGLFWLFSLFTAYQAILFAPLAYACLRRQGISQWKASPYFGVPILLLLLYSLSNPLVLASMVTHGGRDLGSPLLDRLMATGRLWLVGGSILFSVLGTWGLLRSRRRELLASFLLVCAYIALSRYDYYAVLFLPLFVAGALAASDVLVFPRITPVLTAVVVAQLARVFFGSLPPSSARETVQSLGGAGMQGTLVIDGPFGHEWQYESPYPVRRFSAGRMEEAGAIVCLARCPEWDRSTWRILQFEPEVWVREKWMG